MVGDVWRATKNGAYGPPSTGHESFKGTLLRVLQAGDSHATIAIVCLTGLHLREQWAHFPNCPVTDVDNPKRIIWPEGEVFQISVERLRNGYELLQRNPC
jgi:hypothetical protein